MFINCYYLELKCVQGGFGLSLGAGIVFTQLPANYPTVVIWGKFSLNDPSPAPMNEICCLHQYLRLDSMPVVDGCERNQ